MLLSTFTISSKSLIGYYFYIFPYLFHLNSIVQIGETHPIYFIGLIGYKLCSVSLNIKLLTCLIIIIKIT